MKSDIVYNLSSNVVTSMVWMFAGLRDILIGSRYAQKWLFILWAKLVTVLWILVQEETRSKTPLYLSLLLEVEGRSLIASTCSIIYKIESIAVHMDHGKMTLYSSRIRPSSQGWGEHSHRLIAVIVTLFYRRYTHCRPAHVLNSRLDHRAWFRLTSQFLASNQRNRKMTTRSKWYLANSVYNASYLAIHFKIPC